MTSAHGPPSRWSRPQPMLRRPWCQARRAATMPQSHQMKTNRMRHVLLLSSPCFSPPQTTWREETDLVPVVGASGPSRAPARRMHPLGDIGPVHDGDVDILQRMCRSERVSGHAYRHSGAPRPPWGTLPREARPLWDRCSHGSLAVLWMVPSFPLPTSVLYTEPRGEQSTAQGGCRWPLAPPLPAGSAPTRRRAGPCRRGRAGAQERVWKFRGASAR